MPIALLFLLFPLTNCRYEANWTSLDTRPNPVWYDEAKVGIFMHWGLYSVPSFASEWFWWYWKGDKPHKDVVEFMKDNYRPAFTYADFGPMFTAEFFDPHQFASVIKSSGAKYFVLTSKHHEGFTMWPSNYSWNWNSMDLGPKRDIVGELRAALLNISGVHFGLYYSLFEWFNPLYLKDQANKFKTQEYVKMVSLPQMHDLVTKYKPDVYWSDGDPGPDTYWNATEFVAWLFNDSPVKDTVLINDRWGSGIPGKHGSFFSGGDRWDPGHLIAHKWENCLTLDGASWGYRRTMTINDVLTINQIITKLARTISCNGNMLLNVGPTHYGRIVPIFEERLKQLGQWLTVNGEAVYGTKPWIHQNDTVTSNIWYTSKLKKSANLDPNRSFNPQTTINTVVYAFVLEWPKDGNLILGAPKITPTTKVSMLGVNTSLKAEVQGSGVKIDLNGIRFSELPSFYAWAIRLENLQNDNRDPLKQLKKKFKSNRSDDFYFV